MKKIISLILALVLLLSLCACGGGDNAETAETAETTVPAEPPTAREQLTELEEKLFNNLIVITTDLFYEPSAVRVLEVCDYVERTKCIYPKDKDTTCGPDTVVVRLQGENRVGGTANNYYIICLVGGVDNTDIGQEQRSFFSTFGGKKEMRIQYEATEGDFAEIGEHYTAKEDASDVFDIGRINRALKEY